MQCVNNSVEELIYKLDLPELPSILTESAQRRLFVTGHARGTYNRYHPKDLLRSEWLTYRDIPWDFVSFFYKHNFRGPIHSDCLVCRWGINWIHQGYTIIEYWKESDIIRSQPTEDGVGFTQMLCSATAAPSHIYHLKPGAYLFNAHTPHRATGFDHRYALSLRCTTMDVSWAGAVALFKDLFVD